MNAHSNLQTTLAANYEKPKGYDKDAVRQVLELKAGEELSLPSNQEEFEYQVVRKCADSC